MRPNSFSDFMRDRHRFRSQITPPPIIVCSNTSHQDLACGHRIVSTDTSCRSNCLSPPSRSTPNTRKSGKYACRSCISHIVRAHYAGVVANFKNSQPQQGKDVSTLSKAFLDEIMEKEVENAIRDVLQRPDMQIKECEVVGTHGWKPVPHSGGRQYRSPLLAWGPEKGPRGRSRAWGLERGLRRNRSMSPIVEEEGEEEEEEKREDRSMLRGRGGYRRESSPTPPRRATKSLDREAEEAREEEAAVDQLAERLWESLVVRCDAVIEELLERIQAVQLDDNAKSKDE